MIVPSGSAGAMRYFTHTFNNGSLKFQARVLLISTQVKAVRYCALLINVTVARGLGRLELGLVRVRRLVQIDMAGPAVATMISDQVD